MVQTFHLVCSGIFNHSKGGQRQTGIGSVAGIPAHRHDEFHAVQARSVGGQGPLDEGGFVRDWLAARTDFVAIDGQGALGHHKRHGREVVGLLLVRVGLHGHRADRARWHGTVALPDAGLILRAHKHVGARAHDVAGAATLGRWIFRVADTGRGHANAEPNTLAVLPKSDMVIVNRANTYEGESTPTPELLGLIEEVLAARTGAPSDNPNLSPLEETPDPLITSVPDDQLREFVGEWPFPADEAEPSSTLTVTLGDGHLVVNELAVQPTLKN